jgi:hypothetical protein
LVFVAAVGDVAGVADEVDGFGGDFSGITTHNVVFL